MTGEPVSRELPPGLSLPPAVGLTTSPHASSRPVPRARVSAPLRPALPRARLNRVLDRLWDHQAALIVAPAGSGKTTLLAQFAASAGVPVAWYRAEASDGDPAMFLHALEQSLSSVFGAPAREPRCLEELVAALDAWPGERVVLVVDDLHSILGTPAETLLERLLEYLPQSVHLLLASRCAPGFDLSRLQVSEKLFELAADELRFRSWEVEQLFREFYGEPLPPEDLAELARRTEGWAAGLQLFHLATRGKPAGERRRLVAELASRSRMVREYLARNVLDHLPDDLRAFLLGTCVLGRLTGPICDELLGRTGSRDILHDLERQQIFTVLIGGDDTYRYHEVLRSHLELVLVEQIGESQARERYRDAGRLLQGVGALPEALCAYCRAEDWEAVAALLGQESQQLAADQGSWLDALPPGMYQDDPWLLLAKARRETALGRLSAALVIYERAAHAFGPTSAGDNCRRERQAIAMWLEPSPVPRAEWMSMLRAATQRDPLAIAHEAGKLPGATGRFTEGAARLLAGHMKEAHRLLTMSAELPDMPLPLGAVARLLATLAACASGRPPNDGLSALLDEAEAMDIRWLTGIYRSFAVLLAAKGDPDVAPLQAAHRHEGDPWGATVVSLFDGLVGVWNGRSPVDTLEEAALGFRRLGAGVLETWARSGVALAMAREGHPEARDVTLAAIRLARSTGVPSAEAMALFALRVAGGSQNEEEFKLACGIAEQCGMCLPPLGKEEAPPGALPLELVGNRHSPLPELGPTMALRCFGGFLLEVGGRAVDCHGLKPRPRAALHLLAMHAGRPVHRESLVEALWPDLDTRAGMRNLHVAISTIRGFLEPNGSRGSSSLILREADAYQFALSEDAAVDLWEFETGLAQGRAARVAGDWDGAIDAISRVLDAYAGELLPEAGPAEWVVTPRERYRVQASEAALTLTELHLERGDPVSAVAVGERGLRIDRYRDSQWRVLVTACERAGDRAAAARARHSYGEVLAELGLDPAFVSCVGTPA